MLTFLAMLAAVLISLVTIAGFLALGAVVLFELGTMLMFWVRHALKEPGSGSPTPAR